MKTAGSAGTGEHPWPDGCRGGTRFRADQRGWIGQLQLMQPFVTLVASALILAEAVTWIDLGFAIVVVLIVAAGRPTRKSELLKA